MATETKKSKAEPAAKSTPAAKSETAAKSEPAAKTEAASAEKTPKAEASETAAPSNYSRGEGQKPVTKAYKENWNAIFGKKKATKKKR